MNSTWIIVIAASVLAFLTKLAGYLIPQEWTQGPVRSRIIALLPVSLLAALALVQTVAVAGGGIALDARAVAILAAFALLIMRANFLIVVLGAALVAAGLRALGWQ